MTAPTHYDVLGVPSTASAAAIRQAYVSAAREHHPDRAGGDADRMRRLNDAWAVLGDAGRREDYDRGLGAARAVPSPTPAPEPDQRVRTDEEELLADLADDEAIGGVIKLPGWLSLLPPAVFLLSLVIGFGGMLFMNRDLLAFAFATFLASCVMFLLSPFVALLASRSRFRSTDDEG